MLDGKTALVTGSTSGIGKGIITELANQGAHVILNGFGPDADITALLDTLNATGTGRAIYHPADMTNVDQITDLFSTATTEFGGVDILVNNAGIQHVAPVEAFPVEKWDAILAIILSSSFHTTRLAMAHMKARKWGRIVNLASAHSLVASPFKSAYVAAKHGLIGLTKTTALECAQDGVTVNAVSPGYVLTPLVEAQIPDTAKARGISEDEVVQTVMLAPQPTKQFVDVGDIAKTITFLCSDAAKGITGSNLSIDGGWTAQ